MRQIVFLGRQCFYLGYTNIVNLGIQRDRIKSNFLTLNINITGVYIHLKLGKPVQVSTDICQAIVDHA